MTDFSELSKSWSNVVPRCWVTWGGQGSPMLILTYLVLWISSVLVRLLSLWKKTWINQFNGGIIYFSTRLKRFQSIMAKSMWRQNKSHHSGQERQRCKRGREKGKETAAERKGWRVGWRERKNMNMCICAASFYFSLSRPSMNCIILLTFEACLLSLNLIFLEML